MNEVIKQFAAVVMNRTSKEFPVLCFKPLLLCHSRFDLCIELAIHNGHDPYFSAVAVSCHNGAGSFSVVVNRLRPSTL
jgi:hypothetical protein